MSSYQNLINEYSTDLKATRSVCRALKDKRDNYLKKMLKAEDEQKWEESLHFRAKYEEYRERAKELSSIISSSQFSIDWLKTGFEPKTKVSKLPYTQREVVIDDVDQALIYLNTTEHEYSKLSKEELEKLDDYMEILAPREKEAFLSIRGKGNTYQETAEYMGVTRSTVQSYIKQAEMKFQKAIDEGVQTSLF